jgi:NADP-dependent aldehyde dehydrogenase
MTRVVSVNPASGDSYELDVEETSVEEVALACQHAGAAATDLAVRPLAWRAHLLEAIASELEEGAPALVELAMRETALTQIRLEGELRRTVFQLRFFAGVVREGSFLQASIDHATDSPMGPLPDLRRVRVPVGPVAVFGSSNFPFAFSVPGGDTTSALAAGCPVVIKAHPAHPATSQATFEALARGARLADAPEGTLGIVYGIDAGIALVENPAIAAVGFTGSVAAGKALWQRANERVTPITFFGELGSANPLVVTSRAVSARASEIGAGIAGSMTLGVGQFCTKPGLLFVPRGEAGDELVAALAGALRGLETMTMLSSSIAHRFYDGVHAIDAVRHAHHIVGEVRERGASAEAQLFEVDSDAFNQPLPNALREECFGPLGVVVRYRDTDDLRATLANLEPSLTFSVFCAEDDPDARWLVALGQTKAGRVLANQFPTGVAVSWSMQHGGPWPSTTVPCATSVGASGIDRWLRPVTYQAMPSSLLPEALRDENPLAVPQRVDGVLH